MELINKIEKEIYQKQLDRSEVWKWADPEKIVHLVVGLRDELELRITNKAIHKAKRRAGESFTRLFDNMKEIPNFDLMLAVYFQSKLGKSTSIYSLRKWVDLNKDKTREELVAIFESSFELGQMFDPNDGLAVFYEQD